MFGLIRFLLWLFCTAAIYLIIGSSILSFIGAILKPTWIDHPVVLTIVAVGSTLVKPFRKLMQWLGIPTRPLDFSPAAAILFFEIVRSILGAFR